MGQKWGYMVTSSDIPEIPLLGQYLRPDHVHLVLVGAGTTSLSESLFSMGAWVIAGDFPLCLAQTVATLETVAVLGGNRGYVRGSSSGVGSSSDIWDCGNVANSCNIGATEILGLQQYWGYNDIGGCNNVRSIVGWEKVCNPSDYTVELVVFPQAMKGYIKDTPSVKGASEVCCWYWDLWKNLRTHQLI